MWEVVVMRVVVLIVKGDGAQVGAVRICAAWGGLEFNLLLVWEWRKRVYVRKVVRDSCPVYMVADCRSRLRRLEVEFGCGPDWPWKRIGWSRSCSLGLERWVGG